MSHAAGFLLASGVVILVGALLRRGWLQVLPLAFLPLIVRSVAPLPEITAVLLVVAVVGGYVDVLVSRFRRRRLSA
jgi:hypothetical protein